MCCYFHQNRQTYTPSNCFLFNFLFQVSDTLKKFALKVTTASVKERKEIFGELKQCTKGKGEGDFCMIVFVVHLFSLG